MTKLNLRKMPDSLPMQMQEVRLLPSGIDVETRTVSLVWTTGATVRRRRYVGWDTVVPFDEVLVVSDKAIDLSRMNAGAPVLDSHSVWSTFSQVAVVERAWIDGGEGKASVRFPKAGIDERADRMFGLVSDGIIKNVSVGYSIDKIRIEEATKKGEVEKVFVERWTPNEISFVTVPADPDAQVRSQAGTFPLSYEGGSFSGIAAAARMRMAEAVRLIG
ncbi:caudovirus prohead protease family protein [Ochrobactrum quorumnocens]|uniref:Caudovirus prohead protease family protein n=1 Tax=Ochrobactrum quorumnocens TaxID=271865 RepID=A0A248UFK5_9HYPH|nr:HK97 family phage prohead protease [[Ochrobactrum] quorumnocens]ASV85310.1 caudovirus prohead protease family protein [[Ochrobactrum] quorumnocens]